MAGRGFLTCSRLVVACASAWVGGCALPQPYDPDLRQPPPSWIETGPRHAETAPITPAAHAEPVPQELPPGVDGPVALAIARNPRLAQASFGVDAAQGRYIQAGLYPNPTLTIGGDEIGDRTGPPGIVTLPGLTQTFVTGRKLTLSQAVAATEINIASLNVIQERYALIGSVRSAYYDLYTLEKRQKVLRELVRITDEAVKNGKNLLENQRIARLDLVQLEVERERFRAEYEAVERELPQARRNLGAVVGDPSLPVGPSVGAFDEVPVYDPQRVLDVVLRTHPEMQAARVKIDRAAAAVRRAQAEVIPDVSIFTGFVLQYQNKSRDISIGATAPVPIWNRNQGAIRAAQAELASAHQEVARVENDLAERVAAALRLHMGARRRAEIYRREILPKAIEAAELSLKAFQGGQFEYLRVIQAQRAVAEAGLEYNKSLGEAWKGAAQLSGLLLEEAWPEPAKEPDPGPLPIPPTGKPGK